MCLANISLEAGNGHKVSALTILEHQREFLMRLAKDLQQLPLTSYSFDKDTANRLLEQVCVRVRNCGINLEQAITSDLDALIERVQTEKKHGGG